jgi:hypothetical protein
MHLRDLGERERYYRPREPERVQITSIRHGGMRESRICHLGDIVLRVSRACRVGVERQPRLRMASDESGPLQGSSGEVGDPRTEALGGSVS